MKYLSSKLCILSLLTAPACGGEPDEPIDTGAQDGGAAGEAGDPPSGEGNDVGDVTHAGVAVTDVSPTDEEIATGDVFLGGYGLMQTRGAATGLHDPIYARALVIRHRTDALALAVLDTPGLSNRVIREMVRGVSESTGIPEEWVYIGSTHSHAGPDFQGLWGGIPEHYRQRVIDRTIDTIVDAYHSTEEAELFAFRGEGPNRNRRGWSDTDPELVERGWTATDRELTVLDARTASGDRIGTLVQFAAHPVKLGMSNRLVSRDFPGFTVDRLEEDLGAPVIYFNGIIGDCSPDGGGSDFEGAEEYGHIVADVALAAMEGEAAPVSKGIVRELHRWEQEVTNPSFQILNTLGVLDYDVIQVDNELGVETQGAYFRLGTEVQGVAFPGEALTRTGLEIKDPMKAPFRFFLGLTTDSLGYFIKSDEWRTGRNGNYEEDVSTGETAGDRAIEILAGAVAADSDF